MAAATPLLWPKLQAGSKAVPEHLLYADSQDSSRPLGPIPLQRLDLSNRIFGEDDSREASWIL